MKILVIGDYCLDEFIYCKCERLSPEAPVPVANPVEKTVNAGMAGNVLENLLSLKPYGINDIQFFKQFNKEVITKTRYIDKESNQTLLRIDENDKVEIPISITDISGNYDAIVISDYGKGFITEEFLIELPKKYLGSDLYLDTKKVIKAWGRDYIIKINESEYLKTIEGYPCIKYRALIITRGGNGMSFYDGMTSHHFKEKSNVVEVNEVSGAGDSAIAALVIAYTIEKKDWQETIKFANKVAAEAVKRVGVVAVKREWIV